MFKKIGVLYRPSRHLKDNNGLLVRARCVDPYASQSFMINRFGWLASDISLLMSAEDRGIQDNLLSRLQTLQCDSPNMSPREMLDSLLPRYCQSFAERARFMDYMHKEHPDFFEDTTAPSESGTSEVEEKV